MGQKMSAYRIFTGKPDRRRLLGRPKRRLEDDMSIKMEFIEIGRGCEMDSCGSGQRSVPGSCEHGNEPSDSMKCWEFFVWLEIVRFLRRIWLQGVS
jgi:hypothetical protein